jgi:hypothetical protein
MRKLSEVEGTPVEQCTGQGRALRELLRPLREVRVWRFSWYDVVGCCIKPLRN